MEPQNNDIPDGKQAHLKTENIYPAPVEHELIRSPESPQTSSIEVTPYRIPWLKVYALGVVPIFVVLVVGGLIVISFSVAISFIAIFGRAYFLLILVPFIVLFYIYTKLKKWLIDYALLITAAYGATICSLYLLISKLPDSVTLKQFGYELTTSERIFGDIAQLTPLLLLFHGLVLIWLVFITDRIRYKVPVIVFVCASTLALVGFAVIFEFPNKRNAFQKVGDQTWTIFPEYLPAGFVDDSASCKKEFAYATWYECTYEFKNYPGYLSEDSQSVINQAVSTDRITIANFYYEPSRFLQVTVIKDDLFLAPFKFKDEKCDMRGLKKAGSTGLEYRKEHITKYPPKLQRCVMVTTPGGRTLYYDSYLNYDEADFAQVPVDFYFEHAGKIVTIQVGSERPLKDLVSSVYYTDPNFQTEFYKFIDSFK